MPSNIKKLLIISCSTGSGHFRAAEALRLTAQRLYPETEILHIDLADYLYAFSRIIGVSSYNYLIYRIPKIYKFIYLLTDRPLTQKFLSIIKPLLQSGAKKFLKKVQDYAPDYIISTHFAPQLILPNHPPAPLDTVITDYHVHRIWLAPNVRNFFVASEETKKELTDLGIKSIAAGIPIHPNFTEAKDTTGLKTKLGINNNWPIALVMPISSGKITAKETINAIFSYNKNINVVAISGKDNQHTFNDLENIKKSGQKNFTILKNADNIDEWMRIADVIVSKAGGLTISEAMYLQKPIIIINPIPGQEDYNTAYLEKNHYGLKADSSDDLARKIQMILANHDITKTQHQSKHGAGQEKSHPNASEIILKKIFLTSPLTIP